MAVTVVDSVQVVNAPTGVILHVEGVNLAAVAIMMDDGTPPITHTVTCDGEAMTPHAITTGTGQSLRVFVLEDPPEGDLLIDASGGTSSSILFAASLAGVDIGNSPFGTASVVEATTGTTATTGAIASAVGDLVLGAISINGPTTVGQIAATGTNQTNIEAPVDVSSNASGAMSATPGDTSVTMSWGSFTSGRRNSVVAFNVAASAAETPEIDDVNTTDVVLLDGAVETNGSAFDAVDPEATNEWRQGAFSGPITISAQSDVQITGTMPDTLSAGGLGPKAGAGSIAVINDNDQEDTQAVTFANAATTLSVDVASPLTGPGTIETTPPAQTGDQFRWWVVGGSYTAANFTANANMTYNIDQGLALEIQSGEAHLWGQPWDHTDSTWGEPREIDIPAEPEPEPDGEQSNSGGWAWALSYERRLAERRNRKRELEEAADAVAQLEDAVDKEIGSLLQKQEVEEERVADLERIKRTLGEFADARAEAAVSLRLRGAFNKARAKGTSNALKKFDKELKRLLEEEEMAVVMLLAQDD